MSDVRAIVSFSELAPITATFKYDSSIVPDLNRYDLGQGSAQVGAGVTMTADSTVGLGTSGAFPVGIILKVEPDGFCSVLVGKVCRFNYLVGSVPAIGRGITLDGAGNAMQAAGGTRAATEAGTVLSLDTTNHYAYVLMF